MAHHRFIAQFEIILAEPNNTSTAAPDPMPADLVQALITEIKKVNPRKGGGQTYKVEKAEKK
jgi:hypothetical protein